MKKTLKSIISLIIIMSTVLTVTPVYAINSQVQNEIVTACIELKKIITSQRDNALSDLKNKIKDNGWDYTLTMSCIDGEDETHEDGVYKNGEYLEIIAAYMSVKKYYKKNDMELTPLKDVPLFYIETEEVESEECIPEKTPYYKYIEEKDAYELTDKTLMLIEDCEISQYTRREDGLYEESGKKQVTLQKRKVKYGESIFSLMTPQQLLNYYGVDGIVDEDYNFRLDALNNDSTDSIIYQTLFAKTPDFEKIADLDIADYENLSQQRKNIITIAKSLINKVPYQWGGKPSKPGYDILWWTYNEKNEQRGLDCSGYVKWVYMTAGYGDNLCSKLHSTYAILRSGLPEIPRDYLLPGDVGVKVGSKTNHTGIYIGKIAGKDMWIHCSSSKNGVTVGEFDFQKFYAPLDYVDIPDITEDEILEIAEKNQNGEEFIKTTADSIVEVGNDGRIVRSYDIKPINMGSREAIGFFGERTTEIDLSENSLDNINEKAYYTEVSNFLDFSEKDINLLAQLIISEAGGEGINGQIAVAEVVRNRLMSPLFPDTIEEVIYQPSQFSHVERITGYTPSENILNIARATIEGRLGILNNQDCLYYKNPKITDDLEPTDPVDWGKYKYYTSIGHHAFYLQDYQD